MNRLTALTAPPLFLRPHLYGVRRQALGEILSAHGLPSYRAAQLFTWVYRKHRRDPAEMTDLPQTLRRELDQICDVALPKVASVQSTRDGNTHKFVLALADGARVECVSMRTPRRLTFCLSSQVGCALKCSFCATGLMGLERNLTPQEIVAQVLHMGDFHGWSDDRFNLVFMGMGEPLANYRHVVDAIHILHDPARLEPRRAADHGLDQRARATDPRARRARSAARARGVAPRHHRRASRSSWCR